jgi:AcrR family transcriptional regulator/DNA-binding MarR family transcriptional regulator
MSVKVRARPASGPARVLEIQRSRILAAMVEECAARGAANVSVAHVVSRAGISRRTFYEIFTGREACFLAAFDEGIVRASRYVPDGYDPAGGWLERIRMILDGLLAFLDAEPDTGQLLIVGSLGAGPEALERRRRVLAQAIATVDEGRDETPAGKELPAVTAEGIVGGALSVLHSRLLDRGSESFLELAGPLTSMVVLPYVGMAAARRELARAAPSPPRLQQAPGPDPLRQLGMRLTYRTIRVLMAVAATPGGSNRQVADESGIGDQGQISKLLARLHSLGLIENAGAPATRGAPNSWILTDRGWEVQAALASR